jgi:hypothetical protein
MSNKNLTIELRARTDKDGRVFYVGKLKAPCLIDCSQGAVFLVFVSDHGAEEMQIACETNKDDSSF